MGVLRSFSTPRVYNDYPYTESLFRTTKYRPDGRSRSFGSKGEACAWLVAFVDWFNHRHRHSGIKFVTPHQRHCDQAFEIYQRRTEVYGKARQLHVRRWGRIPTACCSQICSGSTNSRMKKSQLRSYL
jgi:putative transposase